MIGALQMHSDLWGNGLQIHNELGSRDAEWSPGIESLGCSMASYQSTFSCRMEIIGLKINISV